MRQSSKVSFRAETAEKKNSYGVSSFFKMKAENKYDYISYAFIIVLTLFLTVAPFYRGLYFRQNYLQATVSVSGVFVLYLLYKLVIKSKNITFSYMDIAVLLIPASYFISFFVSANAKLAFDGIIKYSSYIMVYYIVSDISKEKKAARLIIDGLIFSLFVGAISTIIIISGLWKADGVIIDKVVFGLYQYTNTTAVVLGAGLFLSFGCLLSTKKLYEAIYYQLAIISMLAVFILTISRGAYLILAILGLIYFIIVGLSEKLQLIINGIISFASALLLVFGYFKHYTGSIILVYFICAIASASLLQWLYHSKIKVKVAGISNIYNKRIYIVMVSFVILLLIISAYREPINISIGENSSKSRIIDNLETDTEYILKYEISATSQNVDNFGVIISSQNNRYEYTELSKEMGRTSTGNVEKELKFKTNSDTQVVYVYFYNTALKDNITSYRNVQIYDINGNIVDTLKQFRFIPERIAERIENFSLKSGYNDARFVYANDGFKIFKDYFLTGTGGGGWESLYRQYQSYPYNTKETHNFYIQYAIETGMLGLIGLAFVLGLILRGFIKNAVKSKDLLSISVYMGLFMILIHASMDLDLSLAAPAYFLWALIGCISAGTAEKRFEPRYVGYIMIGVIIVGTLLFYNSVSAYKGMVYGNKAAKIIREYQTSKDVKDMALAEKYLKKAIQSDELNGAYRMDYAMLLSNKAKSTKDIRLWGEAEKNIREVQRTEPYNADYLGAMVNLLLQNSQFKEAVDLIDKAIANQPMNIPIYQLKINANYAVAEMFFKNGKHADAIYYLDNMIEVEKELESAQSISTKKIEIPTKILQMTKLAQNWKENAGRNMGATKKN